MNRTPPDTVTSALAAYYLEEKGHGGAVRNRTHSWASGWHPCERAMCLDLLAPEDREPPNADRCAAMKAGEEFERDTFAALSYAGSRSSIPFRVVRSQEYFTMRGKDGRVVLTGKIDGMIVWGDGTEEPFETKAGKTFQSCRTVEDLLRGTWTKASFRQILCYLLGFGKPIGRIIVRTGGIPASIPVVLEDYLDLAEQFMQAAEQAVGCKLDGDPLPEFSDNPEDCQRCDHRGKSCAPQWFSGEGPYITTSRELVGLVAIAGDEEKAEAAKEHGKARARLRDLTRGKPLVIIGDRTITGRQSGNGWRMTIEKG